MKNVWTMLLACSLGVSSLHGQLLVDDFASGIFDLPIRAGNLEASIEVDAPYTLTGSRFVIIGDPQKPATSTIKTVGDYLSYNRKQNGYLKLIYSGSSEKHVDFGSADAFRLSVEVPGPTKLTITLRDHGFPPGGFYDTRRSQTFEAYLEIPTSGTYFLPFWHFRNMFPFGSQPFNWHDVGTLYLELLPESKGPVNGPGEYRFLHFDALRLQPFIVFASTKGGGRVSLDQPSGEYQLNSVAVITATPDPGWVFLNWTGATNSTKPTLALRVDGAKNLEAVFGTAVSGQAVGAGQIAFVPAAPPYAYGSTVTATATPGAGSYFAGWSNGAGGAANPLAFTVTAPTQTITATFARLYTISTHAIGAGEVRVSPEKPGYLPGAQVELSAWPAPGAAFKGWSGSVSGTNPAIAITVSGDVDATAEFIPAAAPGSVMVTTIAGSGASGNLDALVAVEGRINGPDGPSVGIDGTIYFADVGNNSVRFLSSSGALGTLAGAGRVGFLDARGTNALFSFPLATRAAANGDILVADTENDVLRRIGRASAEVRTFSGSGARGYRNGPASVAQFAFPNDLVEAADGSFFVTEFVNHTVRRVSQDGSAGTFAGSGAPGYRDGAGLAAEFNQPAGIAIDPEGNLYVTEWGNHRIRKISRLGTVSTIAGNGEAGLRSGAGTSARFKNPNGIAVGAGGELFIADTGNHAIRQIARDGSVSILAGTGSPGFADGDGARAAFNSPGGIAIADDGSLIVADSGNNRLRRIVRLGKTAPSLTISRVEFIAGPMPGFQVLFKGDPSAKFRIESSTDLRTWTAAKDAFFNSAGELQIFGLAENARVLYRAVALP